MTSVNRIRIRTGCPLVTTPPIIGGIAAAGRVLPVGHPFRALGRNTMVNMLTRLVLALLLALAATLAQAQSVANGQSLYQGTCNSCHGTPPSGGPELAANNPTRIKNAINGVVPAMSFLRGMYSDAQLADIVAYIGSLQSGPPPPPSTTPLFDYTDLWCNPIESGSGFNIIQHAVTR